MTSVDREQVFARAYADTGNIADALVVTLAVTMAVRRKERMVQDVVRSRSGRICASVCLHFGLTMRQLRSRTKMTLVCDPRAVAVYLIRKHEGLSWPSIGRAMGGYHHTSMMWAAGRVERRRDLLVDANEIELLLGLPPKEKESDVAVQGPAEGSSSRTGQRGSHQAGHQEGSREGVGDGDEE